MKRRNFLTGAAVLGSGLFLHSLPATAKEMQDGDNINHIGPRAGFTLQIGTLISQLDWLTQTIFSYNSKLKVEDLDFLFDKNSNTIGSLIMHVAATEVLYQDITFFGFEDFSPENKKRWGVAMDLGDLAQKEIKGHDLDYYKSLYTEVRDVTKTEFKKRKDDWLLQGATKEWDWNNHCKWFHVAEHIANHRGQMTWYQKRLPVKG